MKIYDISMNITKDMMVYKNKVEKQPKLKIISDHIAGNVYESNISIDLHTGTHIDAPLHMIKDGETIESYPLENFINKCKVIDLTNVNDRITANDLVNKNIQKNDFILFKTKNSYSDKFEFDFVFLEKSGAEFLKSKKVIGVGIDSLGIERDQKDHETHKILLGNNIIILEGLRLKDIDEGEYTLYALPLKIDNVEASPTRAILVDNN